VNIHQWSEPSHEKNSLIKELKSKITEQENFIEKLIQNYECTNQNMAQFISKYRPSIITN